MASMILHPFSESTGIEYLEGLHAVALELRDTFSDNIVQRIGESTSSFESHLSLSDHLDSSYYAWPIFFALPTESILINEQRCHKKEPYMTSLFFSL